MPRGSGRPWQVATFWSLLTLKSLDMKRVSSSRRLARERGALVKADDADVPLIRRPRALEGLILLREAEPGWMGAGEWGRRLNYTVRHAAKARRYLQARGCVHVEEGYENKVPFVRMRLTPKGQAVADYAIAIRDVDDV